MLHAEISNTQSVLYTCQLDGGGVQIELESLHAIHESRLPADIEALFSRFERVFPPETTDAVQRG